MEQAAIFGRKRMIKVAALHSTSRPLLPIPLPPYSLLCPDRTFSTNVPDLDHKGIPWRDFVMKLNPDLFPDADPRPKYSTAPALSTPNLEPGPMLDQALDLLSKCMDPMAVTRITARDALYHPFLAEEDIPIPRPRPSPSSPPCSGDDAFFPHPFGQGVCAALHFKDEVTEMHYIRCQDGKVKYLEAGQGIAIGPWPCEFHRELAGEEWQGLWTADGRWREEGDDEDEVEVVGEERDDTRLLASGVDDEAESEEDLMISG